MKLVNPLESRNMYIYHYTSCDTALNYILENRTLMFNSFSNVNDPRESKHWDISPFVRLETNLKKEDYENISKEVSEMLKGNAKILCFSGDKKEAEGAFQPEALFDRGFTKPNMWHHYGDKHNGVCLMFNLEKLNKEFERQLESKHLFRGDVNYTNEGILPKFQNDTFVIDLIWVTSRESYLKSIEVHFNSWHKDLFLRKLTDWNNENEYRWIYLDTDSKPLFVEFGDSLEAIVAGEKVDDENFDRLYKHCVTHSADLAQLEWHNGFPKLERIHMPRKNGTGWFSPRETVI